MKTEKINLTKQDNAINHIQETDKVLKEMKEYLMKPSSERGSFDFKNMYNKIISLEEKLNKKYEWVKL